MELGVHPMAWLPSAASCASDCSQHHGHSLAWRILSLKTEFSHPLCESGNCSSSLSCSFQGDEQPGDFWRALTSHPTQAVHWVFIHPQRAKHFLKAKRTEFFIEFTQSSTSHSSRLSHLFQEDSSRCQLFQGVPRASKICLSFPMTFHH